MTTAVSALLRLDLIKRYWPYYLAVSALTVTVQVALVVMIGVRFNTQNRLLLVM